MSKKSLLNENTIRRFMKLASIGPLTEDFVDKQVKTEEEIEEGYGMPGARDEEGLEEPPLPAPEEEEGMPELPPVEPEEEVPGMEPEEGVSDLGLTPEAAEEVAEKLASGFAEVVQDALGVEGLLTVEKEGEEEVDLGAEEEFPAPEEELPAPEGEEVPGLEPEVEEEPMMQESVINELAKRVTERLMQQGKEKKAKEKYIDKLSDQIVKRIFSSSKTK